MPGERVHVELGFFDDSGRAIIGARATPYEADGTTPLAGMKSAATGGSNITSVSTGVTGKAEFWITGLPRRYKVVWDDNSLTARVAGHVNPLAAFSVTRGPHDMVPPPLEAAQLDENQTWTGAQNFTGGLTVDGEELATDAALSAVSDAVTAEVTRATDREDEIDAALAQEITDRQNADTADAAAWATAVATLAGRVTATESDIDALQYVTKGIFNVAAYGAKGDGHTSSGNMVGTDDTDAIEAAIAAVVANGGGALYFPKQTGDFYITRGGHVLSVTMMVYGDGGPQNSYGFGTTALKLKNSSNADMLTASASACTVRDLSLYGNKANQSGTSNGLTAVDGNYFKFQRLWIADFLTDNIVIKTTSGSGSLGGSLQSVESRLAGRYGINHDSGSDCTITESFFAQNGASGMYLKTHVILDTVHSWGNGTDGAAPNQDGVRVPSGGYVRAFNSYFESNGGYGAYIVNAINCIWVGCDFFHNYRAGQYVFGGSLHSWVGCTWRDNGQSSLLTPAAAGLYLDTTTACTVNGGVAFDSKSPGFKHQTYGYAENGDTCVGCRVTGLVSRNSDHIISGYLVGKNTRVDYGSITRVLAADTPFTSSTLATLLSVPVSAGETWLVEGAFYVNGGQTGDFRVRLSATGATSPSGYFGIDLVAGSASSTSSASSNPSNTVAVQASGGSSLIGGLVGTSVNQTLPFKGIVVVGSADASLDLQAAEGTTDATATTVLAGTWMKATRIA